MRLPCFRISPCLLDARASERVNAAEVDAGHRGILRREPFLALRGGAAVQFLQQFLVPRGIQRLVDMLGAGRLMGQGHSGANGTAHETAAAVRTDPLQHLVDAADAESALVGADHRLRAVGG